MRSSKHNAAILAAAVTGALANGASAQLTFDSTNSVVTYRHTEVNSSSTRKFSRGFTISTSTPSPPTFVFQNSFSLSGSSTASAGSVAQTTNSTTASFKLASGTGVTQVNPGGAYVSFSELNIDFNLRWNVGAQGWGGGLGGNNGFPRMYTSFGVAGNVGTGGFTRVIQGLNFTSLNETGAILRTGSVNFDRTYSDPGSFTDVLTSPNALLGGVNQALPPDSVFTLTGTIKFRAKNDGGPSDIQLVTGEFGSLNGIFTYVPTIGGTGNWHDPAQWNRSIDLAAGTTPGDGVSTQRAHARFFAADSTTESRTVTLDDPPTLPGGGTTTFEGIEFDDLDSYTLNRTGINMLAVNAFAHTASNGNGQVTINTPIFFYGPDRRIQVDSLGGTVINAPLTQDGAVLLAKDGRGTLTINSASPALTGRLRVREGTVVINDPLALGSTNADILATLIEGSTTATVGVQTPILNASSGGVVALAAGVTPRPALPAGIPGTFRPAYALASFGAIAGDGTQLSQMQIGTGSLANLSVSPLSVIVHRQLTNPASSTNDVQNLPAASGANRGLTYGIGANFNSGSLASNFFVGQVGSPYSSFGVDRAKRSFGFDTSGGTGVSTTTNTLTILGQNAPGFLFAPGEGTLILHSRLNAQNSLTIDGQGVIVLNNATNTFNGGTFHIAGSQLYVNGSLGSNATITGGPGAYGGVGVPLDVPAIGGTGTINANIDCSTPAGGMLIKPGGPRFSPGTLTVNGTVTHPDLGIDVYGALPGEFDSLSVTNLANGMGAFSIGVAQGRDTPFGEAIPVIRYGTIADPRRLPSISAGYAEADQPINFEAGYTAFIQPDSTLNPTGPGKVVLVVFPFVPAPAATQWDADASGLWSTGGNWSPAIAPDGFGQGVNFGQIITANQTVTLDSPRTVGTMTFLADKSYTIAGGSTLTINGPLNNCGIEVRYGQHAISAGLNIGTSAFVTVHGTQSMLTTNNGAPLVTAAGVELTKQGSGVWELNSLQTDSLIISGGTVRAAAGLNNDPARLNVIQNLSIDVASGINGRLDLTNQSLLIQSTGTPPYEAIRQLLAGGFNGGNWGGNGIISSTAAGSGPVRTAIAIGDTPAGLLLSYTIAGDANGDLVVNLDDFTALAGTFGATGTYAFGDLNYNSTIDLDDFTILAANFGQVLLADAPRQSAVPEPASGAAFTAATMLLRRRRRCDSLSNRYIARLEFTGVKSDPWPTKTAKRNVNFNRSASPRSR